MQVRIEKFSGKKAEVYGVTTRGEELLVGHLAKEDDGFHFYYNRSTARGITSWIRDFWTTPEFKAEKAKAEAEYIASCKAEAAGDAEFRDEVMAELIAEGKAAHVAANLTNTPQKLMAEAKRVGVI